MKIIIKLLLTLSLFLTACSKTIPAPQLSDGIKFPTVSGQSLKKQTVQIPKDYEGKNTVVLIGYVQKAQFDIDRWILGILQADVKVEIVELPTIKGMMPQMVQGFITGGMRKGIPEEDWATVVTVFEDADTIINAFGNEQPQNAHVVLLDKSGTIRWTSSKGYSAAQILDLKSLSEKI